MREELTSSAGSLPFKFGETARVSPEQFDELLDRVKHCEQLLELLLELSMKIQRPAMDHGLRIKFIEAPRNPMPWESPVWT